MTGGAETRAEKPERGRVQGCDVGGEREGRSGCTAWRRSDLKTICSSADCLKIINLGGDELIEDKPSWRRIY